jgi:N-acetylglutamate synthase/N-acetylornithine aminotransferase
MCIYCNTTNYRKIYENHHGPILKDEEGRTYEIHHIDGDHSNNDPVNLTALTLQEHYNIHYSQGDYYACVDEVAKNEFNSRRKVFAV